MKEQEPKSVQKTRITLDIWPISAIRQARQEPGLRQECVEEILAAARNSGIELDKTCLSSDKKDQSGTDNLVRRELQSLKKQGVGYSIDFFIDDGSKSIPTEFLIKTESGRETFGKVGVVLNPNYSSLMQEYWGKRKNVYETIVKPVFEQEYSNYQKRYSADLDEWDKKHQEWEETPMSKWEEMTPSGCQTCYGAGTHPTGQSGIGDVLCLDCGGSGRSSIGPSDIREQNEPVKPIFYIDNIQQREENSLSEELKKQGISTPKKEFSVYARFILQDQEK